MPDLTFQAQSLVSKIFRPDKREPSTFYKILLLGIRDAHDYHRDLLGTGEKVDEAARLTYYYQEGLRFWKLHDRERAVYFLGGALYHLQDAWLGLAENPSYEAYLEKALEREGRAVFSPKAVLRVERPGEWAKEALEEREKVSEHIREGLSKKSLRHHPIKKISLELLRRAESAGTGLVLQFFLEALQTS